MESHRHECKACEVKPRKWYQFKTTKLILFFLLLQITHLFLDFFGITILHNLLLSFYDYLKMIWLPIFLGLLIGGFIDYFIPKEYVMKYLARKDRKTIFYSVGLGFLMSACSHGILAISMELYKKGASVAAIIAFLLASPWANLPITFLLFSFFGIKAAFFILSAISIAIATGLLYQFFDKKGLIETQVKFKPRKSFSIIQDLRKRWKSYKFSLSTLKKDIKGILKGSLELTEMVLWWVLIGVFLASLARAYIPHNFFMKYMGSSLLGLGVTLLLATLMEICSEGTAPLAFEIFRQTNAFGNSFVFLMAGVVTDYTEIGLIWSNVGKKAAILLPLVTVPQVLILGYLFNIFL